MPDGSMKLEAFTPPVEALHSPEVNTTPEKLAETPQTSVEKSAALQPRQDSALEAVDIPSADELQQHKLKMYQETLARTDIPAERRARVEGLLAKLQEKIAGQSSHGGENIQTQPLENQPPAANTNQEINTPTQPEAIEASPLVEAVKIKIEGLVSDADFKIRSAERANVKLTDEIRRINDEIAWREKKRGFRKLDIKGLDEKILDDKSLALAKSQKEADVLAKQNEIAGFQHAKSPEVLAQMLGQNLVNPGEQVSDRQLAAIRAVIAELETKNNAAPLKKAA